MIKYLQKKYALSETGAKDLIKGCIACVMQNISFMFPVGLLYSLVSDLINGGVPKNRISFYIIGCVLCIGIILVTTYFQYNATYLRLILKVVYAGLPWQKNYERYQCPFLEKRIWRILPVQLWQIALSWNRVFRTSSRNWLDQLFLQY